ncbi:MAG TPA: NADH-quinone oxidoreductase subunit M [Segeticoccus sp.]|uniref:NADH-quinone oxidoreductase subunit M n=1 Tax=Segeticoccus sp. TaxID=2706531 RepID=UPI002D7F7ADF|nr:NADH-quinone oxidoreductase subunit M [Segeticoccus sp.]HET8601728.1 NADH-quinone oxidoreductase subunit M [Segeticoccus sp.]
MSDFPWLSTIGAIPLVGSLVVAFLPRAAAKSARMVALVFSLVTLGVAVAMATQFRTGATQQFQFTELHSWIPQFGVNYSLGVDGIALVLILMSLVLVPVSLLAAWNDEPEVGRRQQTYFALMLVLETFIVGVFSATDVFLFYLFFEAMLIPVYFLIGSFGGERRRYASLKFLLYSLAGGLIMLVAVIALYIYGPGGADGFLVTKLTGVHFDATAGRLMFLGFFFAFAVKAPMWPVHTWLPDAATEAPPATSVLLLGVLDKVGTFGMIRFCLQLFPDAAKWATPVIIALAVLSILYGALVAIGQRDMLRLIAYTSISHFGFIVLGIFAMTTPAGAGSTLYMVNHGFTTAALFLVAGMLIKRRGSKFIPDFGGWQKTTPVIAGVWLLSGLSGLALPGLNSFVSEFLVLVGTFQRYQIAAIFGTICIIFAAIYILWMYKRMMHGPETQPSGSVVDMTTREKWVVAPIIAAFLFLGFYPKPALDVINPAVSQTLHHVGVTEPAPLTGAAADGGQK